MPSYLESSSDDIKDSAQLFVGLSSRVQDFITHLDSVQANYLAMINLQVSEQSHAVNLLMEKLQVVSCVFLPLTLASGIMGMNVPIPGSEINDGDDTYFWCLLGAFALVAIVSTYFLMHSRAPVLASDATELPADDAGDPGAAIRLRSRKASLAIVGGKVSGV
jgi:Mg2+ and Co2+ transporter CorA